MRSTNVPASALVAVMSGALLLWPSGGSAQIPRTDFERLDPSSVAPELEIDRYRVYDGEIRVGDELRLVAKVVNNGRLPGAYDYALGPEDGSSVTWRAAGTNLDGDDDHLGWFRLSHKAMVQAFSTNAYDRMGRSARSGLQNVCLSLFLVKDGTRDKWTDSNNGNHRERVCFKFYFPPQ